jgi:branched-chain amino acid transport system substrate-binding protein
MSTATIKAPLQHVGMRTRRRAAQVLCAVLLGVAAAEGAWAQPARPVRVGFVAPLSGPSGDFGNSARFGAELAVAEVNSVGGYLGRPVELVLRDDKAEPEAGLQAAHDLVLKEKVAFTIGYCNTGVVMKALPVFQDNRHVLMVPCAQGTAVTTTVPPAQSYVFRNAPRDVLNAQFLIADIVDRRKLRQVAIFADQTGYGEGGLADLTEELAKRQLKPVHVVRMAAGVSSLADEMRAAKAAGAEAIVCYAVGPEQAVAAKSRLEAGVTAPFLAPWPLSFRSVLQKAGARALEGTMMVQTIVQDTYNERRASFLARYFKHSNDRPIGSLMAAAQAYDAVHLMLRAAFQARGELTGQALKAALEQLDKPYHGVVTTYERPFSSTDHDAIALNMLWLGVWRNGEVQYHYPEDAKRAGMLRRKQ